jgi:tRNA(fMet)-specific endonuclease VapC
VIHLDTNVAIALLNGRPAVVRDRLNDARVRATPLALSAVVFHELRYGAAGSARPLDNERKIDLLLSSAGIEVRAFGADEAAEAGRLHALLRRAGTPIGPYDVMIAAQALRAGATLVTANAREFARVPGLHVIDWAPADE